MTPEQREELKQAASAATPGPWVHTQFGVLKAGKFAEYTNGSAQEQIGLMCGASWMREGEHHVNAAYVALANPAAILSLIAQVEALTVPQPRFTCDGKGGTYERIGTAKGAGTSRDIEDVVIYRDCGEGTLYYRTEIDFAARMIAIPAIPGTKEGA